MPVKLTVLGSSSALPTTERNLTAHLLTVNERYYLIDCGEGTQLQLRKARIKFGKLSHIFISHLHGDHFYGLIGLISTFSLLGIKNDLHVFAHSELQKLIQPLLDNIRADIRFRIIFHPLDFKKTRTVFSDKNIEVTSFPLKHSIPVCGFIFREKQKQANLIKEKIAEYDIPVFKRNGIKNGEDYTTTDGRVIPNKLLVTPPKRPCSYGFCTDTAFFEPVAEVVKGVDLLYHEATFGNEDADLASKTGHSTASQAATIASVAGAAKLIIGHFSSRYKDIQVLVNEARVIFPETYSVNDGDVYHISS